MLTVTLWIGGGIVFLQTGYCGVQMVVWTTVGVIGRHCWLSECGCALLCHSWNKFNYMAASPLWIAELDQLHTGQSFGKIVLQVHRAR